MENLNINHVPYEGRKTFSTNAKHGNILKRVMGYSIQYLIEGIYTHRAIEELVNEIERSLSSISKTC